MTNVPATKRARAPSCSRTSTTLSQAAKNATCNPEIESRCANPERDHQRVDERRLCAEEAPAALSDAVAQRASTTPHGVELADAPGDENAASRVREASARDNPGCATVGWMAVRPANSQCAAARTCAHDTFGDATACGHRVGQLDNDGMGHGCCPGAWPRGTPPARA